MRVLFDDRASGNETGVGRYSSTLAAILRDGGDPETECLLASEFPALRALTSRAEEELVLPAVLEREAIDLFHSPLFHLPILLPDTTRAIVTLHDAIPVVRPDLSSPGFKTLFEAEGRSAAQRARLVVCPSKHACREVGEALDLPAGRLVVVPECPAAVFRPLGKDEIARACQARDLAPGRYLLAVGSLEPRKGPDLALEALALLSERHPELKLVFAGPRAGFDLETEAWKRGLREAVVPLGRVSDEELVALLGGALCLLFPSRHEGFGLPVVEAFACGTPVIAANATSIPEVAGEAAILVPPEDPRALAEAVLGLARQPELGRELARRGRARVAERFTPDHVRAALAQVYARLGRELAVSP